MAVWWKALTQDSPPWYFNFVSVQLNWAQAWSFLVHKCLITFNKTALRNIFLCWKSIPVWGLCFIREGTGYVLLRLCLLCHSLLVSLLLTCRSVRGSRQCSQVKQILSRVQRFHCNAYWEGVPVEKSSLSPSSVSPNWHDCGPAVHSSSQLKCPARTLHGASSVSRLPSKS